jgi:uncharacterized membrane protein YfcA
MQWLGCAEKGMMTTYTVGTVFLLFAGASIAGFFGALLGIGGGIFIVPLLVLVLHLPMKTAIAASLVAVIATSNAGGSKYVDQHITNIRLAMFLEVFTTVGAIAGSILALFLQDWIMLLIFSGLLINMAWSAFATRKLDDQRIAAGTFANIEQDAVCRKLRLHGEYHDQSADRTVAYLVTGARTGAMVSFLAGIASGLLGIGGGVLKVSAMNRHMNVPMKVAVATSKLMIGITAAVGSLVFFIAGLIQFGLVGPIALGTTCGATAGSMVMNRISSTLLKKILMILMLYVAYSMVSKALQIRFGIALPGWR